MDMRRMFESASSFNQPLNKWKVSKVSSQASLDHIKENDGVLPEAARLRVDCLGGGEYCTDDEVVVGACETSEHLNSSGYDVYKIVLPSACEDVGETPWYHTDEEWCSRFYEEARVRRRVRRVRGRI
jgi:hypothetical protein